MAIPLVTRILIADDHAIVRSGLRRVLDAQSDLRVVAEASDGAEAVEKALATSFTERAGLEFEKDFARKLPPLEPDVELAVYRVAQESLTNVARHADAGRVKVRLETGVESVVLSVSDDGRGFRSGRPPEGHGGIRGMRERALLVGGALAVKPGPSGGVEVRFEVPAASEPVTR